jgi:hypothetical protein
MAAYTLELWESGAWGVSDGTRCVVSGAHLRALLSGLGEDLGLAVTGLTFFDTGFQEWCQPAELTDLPPATAGPVKIRLSNASYLELEPEPALAPAPAPACARQTLVTRAATEAAEEIEAEEAEIEADEAAKRAAFASAKVSSRRRGGVSSLRQTKDVEAEMAASARATAAALAAGSSGLVEEAGGRLLVLELVCGSRLPAKDFSVGKFKSMGDIINRTSDPYALIQLLDGSQPVGPIRRSPTKLKTLGPIWRFYVDFALVGPAAAATHVNIEIWDYDLATSDDFMCAAQIPLTALSIEPRRFSASTRQTRGTDTEQVDSGHKGPQLVVRRVQARPTDSLTIFFVRHAESEWNRAKRDKDIAGCLKQVNHPLSKVGIEQCWAFNTSFNTELQQLREQSSVAKTKGSTESRLVQMERAEAVFASPLTRAAQVSVR